MVRSSDETNPHGPGSACRARVWRALALTIALAALFFTFSQPSALAQTQVTPVTVSFSSGLIIGLHEGRSWTMFVELSADPGREVTIPITATHRGGATSADYSGVPASVTFGDYECRDENDQEATCYETEKSIRITAVSDADDDGESVVLGFGAPLPDGVTAGPQATRTIVFLDGGEVYLNGLAQVGIAVTASLDDLDGVSCPEAVRHWELDCSYTYTNLAWQWQRSATEAGTYTDIPAAQGGTSNPYTPSASDLGMWLRAKVTYDVGSSRGRTARSTALQPVHSQPVVSNAGYSHFQFIYFTYDAPQTERYAQGFTTGPDTSGYLLTGVRLALQSTSDAVMSWAVHTDDDGKPAATPLSAARPILPTDLDDQNYLLEEFTHPDGVSLQPSTKYWIVVRQTTADTDDNFAFATVGALSDHGDTLPVDWGSDTPYADPGSADDWSIDLEALVYYYNAPDYPFDDNPDPALLPWTTLTYGVQLQGRMVLRMALLIAPEVTVEFDESSYTVDEGGTQTVTVELSADPERTVTIPITATGEGGADSADYSGVPDSVTFNKGETSKSFTFTATDDTVDDDDESVKLGFGTMPDAWVTAGTTDEATVAINDDDDPIVTVAFGQDSHTVAEGASQSITVTLSADPERTVAIPLTTTNRGGATSADYSGVPASVTFDAGETSKSFTFAATDDTVDDDDESVKLGFGTMPDARVSAGRIDETIVSITDDDDPEVTVQFGQDSQGVGEGETVNVTIRLSADPERTVTIPVTATGQDGATSADYTVSSSVTFNSGETEKTIPFMAVNDDSDDDDESVKLGFGSSLPARVTAGARNETTLNIGDDDDPEVTVAFASATYTVAEGASQTVTVSVSADPERTIIIPITTTLGGTASAADYSGVPASVTFTDGGSTSQTFSFAATQDRIDDDGESVELGFGTMPDPRVTAGTTDESTVSITDDDTAGIVFSPTSVTLTEEAFSGASYTVALATEPTVDVTVTLSGHAGTDLTLGGVKLSGDALTFTPDNWDTPQTVTIAAAHDDDGVSDDVTLTHTAAGGEYANVTKDLPVTVTDNDPLGITIAPSPLEVDESDSADYTVVLDTEPTVNVTVTVTGHSGTDLTLSGTSLTGDALTFTAANWDTPQTVTVTAAHDEDIEDDTETLTHTGSGGEYANIAETLTVTILDNTGDVRLMGGTLTDVDGTPCEGRVEVYYDGEWGTVCDDYWTDEEADVVCRQMGFVGGSVEEWNTFRNSYFPPGPRDQAIVLDNVKCSGDESELFECTEHQDSELTPLRHNCKHFEDVGIRCIRNSEGPYVTNMVISGPQGDNGKYDVGETVTVTVTWSEPVNVNVLGPDPPHTEDSSPAPAPEVRQVRGPYDGGRLHRRHGHRHNGVHRHSGGPRQCTLLQDRRLLRVDVN